MEGEMQAIPTEIEIKFPVPKLHPYNYMPEIMKK
jgi:hypothetical protein